MKDIEGKEDIITFVDDFYGEVRKDELLAPIFESKIGEDWDVHLEKMYDFWNTILFSKGGYKSSPFQKHEALPVSRKHFERWLELFETVLKRKFAGVQTEETIKRAQVIGWTFWSKIAHYQSANGSQTNS